MRLRLVFVLCLRVVFHFWLGLNPPFMPIPLSLLSSSPSLYIETLASLLYSIFSIFLLFLPASRHLACSAHLGHRSLALLVQPYELQRTISVCYELFMLPIH
ncbi:hypothetical protein F5148DRAFT_1190072 [Russula earlei]|uniref:Uncharacterized protein n=1 Tax=Russula earlei TaxID=71964 RepID=A0ACC0UDG7_9AGAM|nr:hypothetical protein F5148DRAFT_1190072 [Russula earlei]